MVRTPKNKIDKHAKPTTYIQLDETSAVQPEVEGKASHLQVSANILPVGVVYYDRFSYPHGMYVKVN